jgi:TRAP-type mannitol/chloroaromatic compound transport system substrate-binding protein
MMVSWIPQNGFIGHRGGRAMRGSGRGAWQDAPYPDTLRMVAGLKIRVPVTALLTSLFSGLGALPSSISYSELYSALQTHIVEGQENPLAQVSTGKLYEVQKYCALSNHCWSGYWIVANRRALSSLPADLLDIVNSHFDAAAIRERACLTRTGLIAHETIVAGALERNQRLLEQLSEDEVAMLLGHIDRLTDTAAKMLDAEKDLS